MEEASETPYFEQKSPLLTRVIICDIRYFNGAFTLFSGTALTIAWRCTWSNSSSSNGSRVVKLAWILGRGECGGHETYKFPCLHSIREAIDESTIFKGI